MSILNTKDQQDLLWGSAQDVAAYLGITPRSVMRYRAGKTLPLAAFKLLQLRHGDLAGIFGPDWDGFTVDRDGLLYVPGFKYGLSAWELRGWFFERQELHHLRREVRRITALYDAAQSSAWAMQKVNLLLINSNSQGVTKS